jgi:hypothetical protein
MVFMVFARVPEELLGVEVSSRLLWEAKARKFDGAVWTRIELCSCQSLLKPGASLLVYTTAAFTMEQGIARRIRVGAVRHRRRTPRAFARPLSCLQAKQPADVEQARGNRSFDSQQERDHLALRITAFIRVHYFSFCTQKSGL